MARPSRQSAMDCSAALGGGSSVAPGEPGGWEGGAAATMGDGVATAGWVTPTRGLGGGAGGAGHSIQTKAPAAASPAPIQGARRLAASACGRNGSAAPCGSGTETAPGGEAGTAITAPSIR